MIELRAYQRDAIQAVAQAYSRGIRRPLVGMPTGTGKTVVFSAITQGAVAKGRRALIVAHRDELISQAEDKLVQVAPELAMSIGIVKARQDDYSKPVTLASVQSLTPRRVSRITDALGPKPFDIIVCDEAHHAPAPSYLAAFTQLGCFSDDPPLTIGVTATPQRADGKNLGDVWEEIVYHRDMLSMMREGYLCNLRGIAIRLSRFDVDDLTVRRGEFVAEEAGEALSTADAPRHVVGAWMTHAKDRKTIVFTPTVALAREMADEFRQAGVSAAMVSGETPLDRRRAILSLFASGEVRVVCNAMVLTEGFDEPGVECIVIARPTRSQPLYVQMVGRGTRIAPGKTDCLVMDVVGAADRMDLTTLPRMFGLGDEEEEGDPLAGGDEDADVVDEVDVLQADQRRIEREEAEGRIVARQVELFDRTALAWNLARPGVWCMTLEAETIILQVGADSRWQAGVYRDTGDVESLAVGLDLSMAMGVAEEYARRAPALARKLIDKAAAWRQHPASKEQRDALRKWRSPMSDAPDLKRGEASDLLGQYIALKQMRRSRR
jgi:superfamily II DNA or RNA helicase